MTGQENFHANDGVSQNNNVIEQGAKCLFADAYSGMKCGGRSANENESSTITQRMNESASSDSRSNLTNSSGGGQAIDSRGTQPAENSNWGKPQMPGGTGYEKPHFPENLQKEKLPNGDMYKQNHEHLGENPKEFGPKDFNGKENFKGKDGIEKGPWKQDGKGQIEKMPYDGKMPYDPKMPKNEKFPNGKPGPGEIEKFPNKGKVPDEILKGKPMEKHGEIEKFPNKGKVPDEILKGKPIDKNGQMEGKLDKLPNKMEGQLDKNFDTKTGKDGQLKDKLGKGETGIRGLENEHHHGGGGGFKNGSEGGGGFGEKHGGKSLGPVDKNGDGTIDGTEKQFDKNGNDVLDELEGLNKKMEQFDKCPDYETQRRGESQVRPAYPFNDVRGAQGTLPSASQIAPDINSWHRAERGDSAGRGGYVSPAETRRQYRHY